VNTIDRAPRRSLSGRLEHNEGLFALLLVLPATLIVLALYVYPLLYSFIISFLRSDIRYPEEFRGLKNYADILRDPELMVSFLRTIYFTVVSLAIEMLAGIAIAVAFSRRFFARPVARSLILIPWAIPPVVNGIIWNWLAHAKIGVLNYVLTALKIIPRYKPGWPTRPGR